MLLSKKRQGLLKFKGLLHNRDGVWYGIELTDDTKGDNNGNMGSQQYFECTVPGKGIFVKPKDLIRILAKRQKEELCLDTQQQPSQQVIASLRERIASPSAPDFAMPDEFEMSDPSKFHPSRAPSQQVIAVESSLDDILRTVPKHAANHNPKSKPAAAQQANGSAETLEAKVQRLSEELAACRNAEIEAKRLRIKTELNNLRPIELMEKVTEFMINTDMESKDIQSLQRIVNGQK